MRIPAEWLNEEDRSARVGRLSRLEWLAALAPDAETWRFPGGWVAKAVFEEARYCFAYGQFLAATLLALAFIERTLAAEFFGAGRDNLERASISNLIAEAHTSGWITDSQYAELEEVRRSRNPVAHFRAPLSEGTIERRAIEADDAPYSLLEKDATKVMRIVFQLIARNAA